MTLSQLCAHVTAAQTAPLPSGHKLCHRLVCPEYSKASPEVKTYPLPPSERIFALCWNICAVRTDGRSLDAHGQPPAPLSLHTTLCPSPTPFCCRLDFTSGQKTQLHTHDYIELSYVVEGEFRQRILGRDIIFTKGDLCLIDKNCLHQDYLLDEPAAGMNPNETAELMETIGFVREKFDMTILLIEHDMKLVSGICEKLTVLNFGQVLTQGETSEVLNDKRVITAYLGE